VRAEYCGHKVRVVTVLNHVRHFALARAVARAVRPSGGIAQGASGLAPRGKYRGGRSGGATLCGVAAGAPGGAPSGAPTTGRDGAKTSVVTDAGATHGSDLQTVDVATLELLRPRAIGVEAVALWALQAPGISELLIGLGVSGPLRSLSVGASVGRLAQPASERAMRRWLEQQSGLGELLEVDFEALAEKALYRAGDALLQHRIALEDAVMSQVSALFGLVPPSPSRT
jgi:hypothetical protein